MPRPALHLRMPGLLGPLPADAVELIAEDSGLSDLAWLLSKGRHQRADEGGLLPPGFEVPAGPDGLPAGALGLLGDGGTPGPHYWFRADPVHFLPDRDSLRMLGPEALSIGAGEAQSLTAAFNEFFADDGLMLVAQTPDHWYLRCSTPPRLSTVPLQRAIAVPIDQSLPGGPDAGWWHARMNEMQMFFHGHWVNQEREAAGRPTINGIWPWGGGRLSESSRSRWHQVFSDDPLVLGLARLAGARADPWPGDAHAVLRATGAGDVLAAAPPLPGVSDGVAFRAWENAVQGLARDWAGELRRALDAGRVEGLVIDTGCTGRWILNRHSRWALWRRPRAFARFLVPE